MYWSDYRTEEIQRANLDGTNIETLVTGTDGLRNPASIALDVAGGKMYWVDNTTQKIQCANFDGSQVEDLVTRADGVVVPDDIALSVEVVPVE